MAWIADLLLGAGTLAAMVYCMVLARRLSALSGLEGGMGGAIAVLSVQVEEMTRALSEARAAAAESGAALESRVRRAEDAAERLEIILAAMHDLPTEPTPGTTRRLRVVRRRLSGSEMEAAE